MKPTDLEDGHRETIESVKQILNAKYQIWSDLWASNSPLDVLTDLKNELEQHLPQTLAARN